MTSERFFATVWRINALAILLTAVLATGILLSVAWQMYKEASRTRRVSNVVNVAGETLEHSRTRLGAFEGIAGTAVLRAPLELEQAYEGQSGSQRASSVQNYLYYDLSGARPYWLVAGYTGLFLTTQDLPAQQYDKPAAAVEAVVYELVETDSDGDNRLTESDARIVAVSDATGVRFTRALTGVEQLLIRHHCT